MVVFLLEDALVLPAERVGTAAPLALGQVTAGREDEVSAPVVDDGGRRALSDGVGPATAGGSGGTDGWVGDDTIIMIAEAMIITVRLVVLVVFVFLTQNLAHHHRHQQS